MAERIRDCRDESRLYGVKDGDVALSLVVWRSGTAGDLELHTGFRLLEDRSVSPATHCKLLPGACWAHVDLRGVAHVYAGLIGPNPDEPSDEFWSVMETTLAVRARSAREKRLPLGEELVECPACKGDGMVEARAVASTAAAALRRIFDEPMPEGASGCRAFVAWAHQLAGDALGWPTTAAPQSTTTTAAPQES